MKILVIEDEVNLRETIVAFLEEEGYCCEQAGNLELGSEKTNLYEYDCMIVDIGLPDGNGLSLVKELKKRHPETGIIIISAKNSLEDKISGLDLGADDYLTKPFHLPELNSRIKSLLRRRKFEGRKEICLDKIRILPEDRMVYVQSEPLPLTKKEFDLLVFFVTNPKRVLTKEAIAEHLWGDFADSSDSFDFVYSHIKNLRRKLLEKTGTDYFQNVYGTGYTFIGEA
ncbi:MAG: response regulator transcription factor [Bacteroidota bacterium]|nr:response regulator transcription factor [Bacteroidota bacterium]